MILSFFEVAICHLKNPLGYNLERLHEDKSLPAWPCGRHGVVGGGWEWGGGGAAWPGSPGLLDPRPICRNQKPESRADSGIQQANKQSSGHLGALLHL